MPIVDDFLEGFESLLLLTEVTRLLEITQQDSKEEVKHDDRSNHEERNEVECDYSALRSDALVHDRVPALAHEHLEDRDDGP